MKNVNTLNLLVASVAAAALMTFAPVPGAGQDKQKGGKGKGGPPGGEQYGPYYAAPVKPGEPVGRTPDGQPDMQGFWTPRFNQAIFEVQDHPTAQPGIGPGKGAIVDPADGRIPYKPEAAAKAKELLSKQIYLEPEAHCYVSGVPHAAYQQFGYQIVQPAGYVLFLTEYAHTYRAIPTDSRPHISSNVKLFRGDSVGKWDGGTLVIDTTNQNGKTWFDMAGNFTTQAIHVVEDQERHGDVAVELRRAGRIVGDGGLQPARRQIVVLLHRPHHRPAAMAVADQADGAPAHEWLGVQEVERARHVGHAHAAAHDVAAAANRLHAARPERIGSDDDIAPARQQLSPHVGMLADAAASVGQHDRREGPGTARPIEPARDLRTGRAGTDRDAGEAHVLGRCTAGGQQQEDNREKTGHAA